MAAWEGSLRSGSGWITTHSEVLNSAANGFQTRFEPESGTNPEELIAAAHAACSSQAFADMLGGHNLQSRQIETRAACSLSPQSSEFRITSMPLEVHADVPGIDRAAFQEIVEEADTRCPVSNLLRPGLDIELYALLT